jgi:hypothetical protein
MNGEKEKIDGIISVVISTLQGRGGFDRWWDNITEFHDDIKKECYRKVNAYLKSEY